MGLEAFQRNCGLAGRSLSLCLSLSSSLPLSLSLSDIHTHTHTLNICKVISSIRRRDRDRPEQYLCPPFPIIQKPVFLKTYPGVYPLIQALLIIEISSRTVTRNPLPSRSVVLSLQVKTTHKHIITNIFILLSRSFMCVFSSDLNKMNGRFKQ